MNDPHSRPPAIGPDRANRPTRPALSNGPIRRPRGHWWLTAAIGLATVLALLAHGYVDQRVGRPSTTSSNRSPNAGLRTSGALLDLRGPSPVSNVTTAGTLALTFDDGPDPVWTPQILDVLARHQVRATFFVVGSKVLANPDVTRAIVAHGHQLGVHTLSHDDLASLPGWQRNLQLSLTEAAIAAVTGLRPLVLRPPYSSTAAAVTVDDYRADQAAARLGYLIALSDVDSEDWRRPGVARIVANATPANGAGGIVLFHDGGGDRAQTVAALDQYLTAMTAHGYRFTTVAELGGLSVAATQPAAERMLRWQGRALLATVAVGSTLARVGSVLLPLLGALTLARTLLLVLFAWRHRRRPERQRDDPSFRPSVTIVVPAYNEAAGIGRAVTSLAGCQYPGLRVVVVDDGSTDDTAAIVESLGLANVTLIRQANRGKPAALNTGIAHATSELVVTVDGDTVFDPDTVRWLVQPFADPNVGAVSGNTKVANRRGLIGRWQHIEYVMGFNLDRRMYELARCTPTVPGAIGAFRRQALTEVGGVSGDTLAEDTDLTMAIARAGWHVVYEERATAWTEAPSTLRQLWQQRYRWSYGTMQSMWKHRGALRPSTRSPIGTRALPYLTLFQVVLPLLAPLIDLFALYGLLFLDRGPVLAFWLGFLVVQLAVSIYAFRLDGERLGPLWALPLQQFVYRQLMYLVVVQSVVTALTGARLPWHKLERSGDFSSVGGT